MVRKWVSGIVCALAAAGLAHGQAAKEGNSETLVTLVAVYVQNCIRADELLRKTCGRIGPALSGGNKKYCELPREPFEARTASSYVAFKESFRAEFQQYDPKIAKALEKTTRAFEQQFAQVRAGKISMGDLDSLSRELGDRCVTVEREWLAPNRRPR